MTLRACIRLCGVLVLITCVLALGTCTRRPGLLEQIHTRGTLTVATVNSATTYYLDADGPAGFEYDLARAFADALGVQLQTIVLPDREAVIEAVANGRANLGAGLAVSPTRRERLRFTPPYAVNKLEAVYRVHEGKPKNLADLSGRLTLAPDTAVVDWLRQYHPDIEFNVDADANTEELLDRVAAGDLEATIGNANIVAMHQRYYPSLRVAFDLPDVEQRLAWAFPKPVAGQHDDALYNKAIAFLERSKNNGKLRVLSDRYFGHAERLGFVGGQEFARQVDARLGRWRPYFKRAGKEYDLDWRLLAAIGYQESHWDKNAVSPTTVKGIMMLTRATAKELDVSDRRDPQQSIDGGARYLIQLRERLPDEITEPDRTWFALAAYNIGYGHVMDARRLLEARGRDPNRWVNLRDALPWLTQDRYLSQTRYGYARGLEAAAYVGNIRAYYDILVWMTDDRVTDKPKALAESKSPGTTQPASPDRIRIDSPAL